MNRPLTFRLCRDLAGDERQLAADLVRESFHEFYAAVDIDRQELNAHLAEQFSDDDSELHGAEAAFGPGLGLCGIYVGYPAECRDEFQRASMLHLLGLMSDLAQDRFFDWLPQHAAGVPPIPGDSFYLARFAVAEAARGSGVADDLLKRFVSSREGLPTCSLHVHSANLRAIAFYRKRGFEPFASIDEAYLAMALTP